MARLWLTEATPRWPNRLLALAIAVYMPAFKDVTLVRGTHRSIHPARPVPTRLRAAGETMQHAAVLPQASCSPSGVGSRNGNSSMVLVLAAFSAAVVAAFADKRRLDEVVGLFRYNGTVYLDGNAYTGQGNVKRCLAQVFALGKGASVSISSGGTVNELVLAIRRRLGDECGGEHRFKAEVVEVSDLGPGGESQISQLKVTTLGDTHDASKPSAAVPHHVTQSSAEVAGSGPKWETFDGRVHQKIWQHENIFEPGNPFLIEKMELCTGRMIVIIDQNVNRLHGHKIAAWCSSHKLQLAAIVAPGNEDQKTIGNMCFMLDELARVDPLRREPVLAIGGGVLTDVAGFALATWRRGIPWCRMPTTLLGMVDASVGIKVAINYKRKNGVGHFYSPLHSFIDTSFLRTLSKADIRSGVGEIMKAALVHDGRLFDLMERHGERLIDCKFMDDDVASTVIKFSVDTMLECIGPDLWEETLVRPMDFGHSLSRTLEASEQFKLRHGEAVAIDCVMSTLIAKQRGLVSARQAQRVLDLYARLRIPCSVRGITAETYKTAVQEIAVHRDGLLRAPLPYGIGSCAYTDEITDQNIDAAFEQLTEFMAHHPEVLWDPSKSFSSPS